MFGLGMSVVEKRKLTVAEKNRAISSDKPPKSSADFFSTALYLASIFTILYQLHSRETRFVGVSV